MFQSRWTPESLTLSGWRVQEVERTQAAQRNTTRSFFVQVCSAVSVGLGGCGGVHLTPLASPSCSSQVPNSECSQQ